MPGRNRTCDLAKYGCTAPKGVTICSVLDGSSGEQECHLCVTCEASLKFFRGYRVCAAANEPGTPNRFLKCSNTCKHSTGRHPITVETFGRYVQWMTPRFSAKSGKQAWLEANDHVCGCSRRLGRSRSQKDGQQVHQMWELPGCPRLIYACRGCCSGWTWLVDNAKKWVFSQKKLDEFFKRRREEYQKSSKPPPLQTASQPAPKNAATEPKKPTKAERRAWLAQHDKCPCGQPLVQGATGREEPGWLKGYPGGLQLGCKECAPAWNKLVQKEGSVAAIDLAGFWAGRVASYAKYLARQAKKAAKASD